MAVMKLISGIFLTLLLLALPHDLFAQDATCTDAVDRDSSLTLSLPQRLKSALSVGDYEKAYGYVLELEGADSLSKATLRNCADCFIYVEKYDECLAFCERWEHRYPLRGLDSLFVPMRGECYYYLGKYARAVDYLARYREQVEAKGKTLSVYYNGIYSVSLYESYRYEEADSVFADYFYDYLKRAGLDITQVFLSDNKDLLGQKLYLYAYNSFFMGEENKGMNLLYLSSKCGYDKATDDYNHLLNCETVLMELDLSRRTRNQFIEYLEKYDIDDVARVFPVPTNAAVDFWQQLMCRDASYVELQAELGKKRKRKMLQKALDELQSGQNALFLSLKRCAPFKPGEIESGLVRSLTGGSGIGILDFRIYPASDPNAFATPYGHIYLTSGLVLKYNFNNHLLLGVCAHEMTHFLCQHSLLNLWKQYEKERKRKIWGGIAAGLYAATMTATTMYGAANGVEYDQSYYDNIGLTSTRLYDAITSEAYYFQFKYSREQEIQSDLMAYRFCEAIGLGGYAYIMALQLLDENDLYMKSAKTDDHPTMAYRIAFLKYVYQRDRQAQQPGDEARRGAIVYD